MEEERRVKRREKKRRGRRGEKEGEESIRLRLPVYLIESNWASDKVMTLNTNSTTLHMYFSVILC